MILKVEKYILPSVGRHGDESQWGGVLGFLAVEPCDVRGHFDRAPAVGRDQVRLQHFGQVGFEVVALRALV